MRPRNLFLFTHWRQDLPASIVVFLLALPLTLGIALASGVPMFSGILTAVVGGVVVSLISQSPLNISGPAASMAVIVLSSVQTLPSFRAFLLAVVLAGVFQMLFGLLRAGTIGELLPASVISGMLAAIGITIILGQAPHALGYDKDAYLPAQVQPQDFAQALQLWQRRFSLEAMVIAITTLAILLSWNHKKWQKPAWLQYLPGSLAAIVMSVIINIIFQWFFPKYALPSTYFVQVPVIDSLETLVGSVRTPDFTYLGHAGVWMSAIAMALIASIQAILGVEGMDKLDPLQRATPLNRELLAQGIGNIVSGMLGGILLTSVIVRSLANVNAGARTRASAILQGVFLLVLVLALPRLLNQIPLAALATVLVFVGFQLVRPAVFIQSYKKGWAHLLPFTATILFILATDLLTGVCAGLMVAVVFILRDTFWSFYNLQVSENQWIIHFTRNLSFIQKYDIQRLLKTIPPGAQLTLNFADLDFIDEDIVALFQRFAREAPQRCIELQIEAGTNNVPFRILTVELT